MEMEGCSSDGSWSVNETSSRDLDTWDVDHLWNQFKTSEAFKCTPQKTQRNRNFDLMHSQSLNKAADEMSTWVKLLREENDRLNAENDRLKGLTRTFSSFLRRSALSFKISKLWEPLSLFDLISDGDADSTNSDILMKLEADDESKVMFSDFTGLDGERKKVGKYSVPLSLHPIANNIIDIHGDVSATGKMNPCASEPIYIMFCASVKEMTDLRLEQVTEDRLFKWRDAIKDALRINFKVDFAMEHLKKIAQAYIVLMEFINLENSALRMFNFMDVAEDKPVSSGEQPIIDCESDTRGDDFDGGKKKQLNTSRYEFLEMMSFEVENKLEAKRKLQLTMSLERMIQKKMQMEESLRDAEVALHEKVKELEMLKRKKRSLLDVESDKEKVVDAFMVFMDAIEKNDTENFNEKAMMNTLVTMMNEDGGVTDNPGNASAAGVEQGSQREALAGRCLLKDAGIVMGTMSAEA